MSTRLARVNNVDVFIMQDANLIIEQIQHSILPKSGQIASKILVGIRNSITSTFQNIKEMQNQRKQDFSNMESRTTF